MVKEFLSNMGRSVSTWTKANQTKILIGASITCTIGAVGTAVVGTIKAVRAIDARKEELRVKKNEKLPIKEVARVCWKYYLPPLALTAGSIGFNLAAESKHTREYAALSSVCALSETALREYKDAVVETIGEKGENRVQETIAKERLEKDPVKEEDIFNTGKGNTLCYDRLSGRYFRCDISVIKEAVVNLSYRMADEMYISLNEFYDEIGLRQNDLGDRMWWCVDNGKIQLHEDYGPAANGEPCFVVGFYNPPEHRRGY